MYDCWCISFKLHDMQYVCLHHCRTELVVAHCFLFFSFLGTEMVDKYVYLGYELDYEEWDNDEYYSMDPSMSFL